MMWHSLSMWLALRRLSGRDVFLATTAGYRSLADIRVGPSGVVGTQPDGDREFVPWRSIIHVDHGPTTSAGFETLRRERERDAESFDEKDVPEDGREPALSDDEIARVMAEERARSTARRVRGE